MKTTNNPKLYLTLATTSGNEENLRELIEPIIEWIDGIVAVYHNPIDKGYDYLESRKGCGKIIVRDWIGRLNFSRNETLYSGIIQPGDICILIDTLERAPAKFVSRLKGDLYEFMKGSDIDCLYYYGKPYIFIYSEFLEFVGSPHCALQGIKRGVELNQFYPDEKEVRENVRPRKRPDPYHFCGHYLGYYLLLPGSNHCLLGLEKNGDPKVLFPIREKRRLEFRDYLREKGYPLTVDGVKQLMKDGLDEKGKDFFRLEKCLNDAYRYFHLGRTDFTDDHDHKNMIEIP